MYLDDLYNSRLIYKYNILENKNTNKNKMYLDDLYNSRLIYKYNILENKIQIKIKCI